MLNYALPLGAAVLYALAALVGKTAFSRGATVWQVAALVNTTLAALVMPLAFLGQGPWTAAMVGPALLCAGLVLAGNITNFLALHRGDVSIVTPVMGTKVVIVALLGWSLFGQAVTPMLWAAAALCAMGIALLQGSTPKGGSPWAAVGFGLASATAFAGVDASVAHFTQHFDPYRFLRLLALFLMGLSLLTWVLLDRDKPWPRSWRAYGAAGLMAFQALLMTIAVGFGGNPVVVNIVYGTRGLWAIVLVLVLGKILDYREAGRRGITVAVRLLGALCLFGAVVLSLKG
ncbi:MAG: EamA family transporter [Candidatus Competibacterales bacterium]